MGLRYRSFRFGFIAAFSVLLVSSCFHLAVAGATDSQMVRGWNGDKFVTLAGAVFQRVELKKFGRAFKAPDGTLWSQIQGHLSNQPTVTELNLLVYEMRWYHSRKSEAARACDKIGGELPSLENYIQLWKYFIPREGALPHHVSRDTADLFGQDLGVAWTSDMTFEEYCGGLWCSESPLRPNISLFDFDGGHHGSTFETSSQYTVLCVKKGQRI